MTRGKGWTSRLRGERGSLTIEATILFPALLAIMFLGVQAAMWFHARSVAIGAAADGARAQSLERAAEGDGRAAALDFVSSAGGDDVLRGVEVSSSQSPTSVSVTVVGSSMSLVPGWDPSVEQSATVPLERITP
ncbi:TadE family protein [Janibacter sp. FSL W8-0316]|uniref:TadE family protein n=1 Tax=Janibacter sp. FSL W8-0316 TaxID=2975325 RepID=UPI0030F963C5